VRAELTIHAVSDVRQVLEMALEPAGMAQAAGSAGA